MRRMVALLPVLIAFQAGAPPALAWTWPVDGPVLRPFKYGDDPYAAGQHRGVDVGADPGDAVRAPVSGIVSFAGTVPGGGRTLTLQTDDGLSVTLVHLGGIAVPRAMEVEEGVVVGEVGPSGEAEHPRPYVHLGVRRTSEADGYLDPLAFLPARAPVKAPAATAVEPAPAASSAPAAGPDAPAAAPAPHASAAPARHDERAREGRQTARAEGREVAPGTPASAAGVVAVAGAGSSRSPAEQPSWTVDRRTLPGSFEVAASVPRASAGDGQGRSAPRGGSRAIPPQAVLFVAVVCTAMLGAVGIAAVSRRRPGVGPAPAPAPAGAASPVPGPVTACEPVAAPPGRRAPPRSPLSRRCGTRGGPHHSPRRSTELLVAS